MNLRLEAAAISEMAENIAKADDLDFRVPKVDWERPHGAFCTLEWIDGIPLTDLAAVEAAGLDRRALGLNVIRSFLKHAIRDGFFHADMHQGNLFADPRDGALIAVDFGIMGRIGHNERRFLRRNTLWVHNQKLQTHCRGSLRGGLRASNRRSAPPSRRRSAPSANRSWAVPAAEISMARLLTPAV